MNQILKEYVFPEGQKLQLVRGDITVEKVDAIVNPANAALNHAGGLAAVISRKGGPQINTESADWVQKHGPVSHTDPAITSAGQMPARYVIHAVGPVWGAGNEDAKLTQAVQGALKRAEEFGLASIAFPAISTGIFGFPKERAAGVIYKAIQGYLVQVPRSGLTQIRLTVVDQPTLDAFLSQWKDLGLEIDQSG